MWGTHNKLVLVLLLAVLPQLNSGQSSEEGSFAAIKSQLQEQFGPQLAQLNETLQDFLRARDDLNSYTFPTPETPFAFDPTTIIEYKAKVGDMVEQKMKYVSQKALLRQSMMLALYDYLSKSGFGDEQHVSETEESPFGRVVELFGLGDDSDGDEDNIEVNAECVIESLVTPSSSDGFIYEKLKTTSQPDGVSERPKRSFGQGESNGRSESARGSTWSNPFSRGQQPWLNYYKGKAAGKEYAAMGYQHAQSREAMWKKFVEERKSLEEESAAANGAETQAEMVEDMAASLWDTFGPAIKALNESFQRFISAKDEMVMLATARAWEVVLPDGNTTFDPQALISFKTQIAAMVAEKNKFVAEKAELKTKMLLELASLLNSTLSGENESAFGPVDKDKIDLITEQLLKLSTDNADDEDGDGSSGNSLLGGLPFAGALALAALPTAGVTVGEGAETAGGASAGEVVVFVVLAVVAVVAAAVLVVALAWRKSSRRRTLYTRVF